MSGPSSRKRTHAEISRSESPLDSPPPSKRQRRFAPLPRGRSALSSPSLDTYPRIPPSPPSPNPYRYEGDRFDYRRPIMSANTSRPEPATIDLTADDDDYVPLSRQTTSRDAQMVLDNLSSTNVSTQSPMHRAPPFGGHSPADVIDLEDNELMERLRRQADRRRLEREQRANPVVQSSPDLVITGFRTLQNDLPGAHPDRRLPTPPALRIHRTGALGDFLTRGHGALFANGIGRNIGGAANYLRDHIFNQLDGLRPAPRDMDLVDYEIGDYSDVEFNYNQAAFEVGGADGGLDRSSTPPEVVDPEPYKKPTPADKDYTRTLAEDEIVVCPNCGDELGTGDSDQKQQIWIAKQCGHVYCGDCGANRLVAKYPNSKQRRTATQRKVAPQIKACQAEGCKSRTGTKTAMVQIYL